MGLDMYLEASKYISPYASHNDPDGKLRAAIAVLLGLKDAPLADESLRPLMSAGGKVTAVRVRVTYWRKAHEIHQWFVDNVQDGDDNCGEYYVDRSDLQELVEFCEENRENEGDEYDDTIAVIKPILDHNLYENFEFYYKASW